MAALDLGILPFLLAWCPFSVTLKTIQSLAISCQFSITRFIFSSLKERNVVEYYRIKSKAMKTSFFSSASIQSNKNFPVVTCKSFSCFVVSSKEKEEAKKNVNKKVSRVCAYERINGWWWQWILRVMNIWSSKLNSMVNEAWN